MIEITMYNSSNYVTSSGPSPHSSPIIGDSTLPNISSSPRPPTVTSFTHPIPGIFYIFWKCYLRCTTFHLNSMLLHAASIVLYQYNLSHNSSAMNYSLLILSLPIHLLLMQVPQGHILLRIKSNTLRIDLAILFTKLAKKWMAKWNSLSSFPVSLTCLYQLVPSIEVSSERNWWKFLHQ